MAITLRQESQTGATTKGSSLTFAELDNNFIDLLTNKIQPLQVDADTGSVTLGEAQSNGVFTLTGGTSISTTAVQDSAGDTTVTIAYTGGASGINNIVEDTTPQLGGHLDVNGQVIGDGTRELLTFTEDGSAVNHLNIENEATGNGPILGAVGDDSNIDLNLLAKGTGHVTVKGNTNSGAIQFNCESNSHGQIVKAQPHSEAITNELLLPKGGNSTLVSESAAATLTQKTLEDYKETVYTSGATTGTITPDVANGNVQAITLTGSITFNAFANAEAGQSMTLIVKQSSSGGETLTSTMKFAGGTKTLSTGANEIDIISVFYDGTTYYASLSTNFS